MNSPSPPDWSCATCTLTMSVSFRTPHLRGRRHLSRLLQTNLPKSPRPQWVTCHHCHITLRSDCQSSHEAGRLHQAQLPKQALDPQPENTPTVTNPVSKTSPDWMCDVCGVPVPPCSRYNARAAHEEGKAHLANFRTGRRITHPVSQTGPVNLWCNVCDRTMNTGSMQSHVSGAGHRARIQAGRPGDDKPGNTVQVESTAEVGSTAKARKPHSPAQPAVSKNNTAGTTTQTPQNRYIPATAPVSRKKTQQTRAIARFAARDLKSHRHLSWLGWDTNALPKGDQKLRQGTVGWHGLVSGNRKGRRRRGKRAEPAGPRPWPLEQWGRSNRRGA